MAKGIGKITAKVVLGDQLKAVPEGGRFEAMRIAGRVDRVTTKPSSLNPENLDVKLTGEFVATNCTTGEQFSSAVLYPIGSAMCDMMANAEAGALFAVRVFLNHSKKTVQGYTFEYETAMEVAPSEAVARMNDAFLSLPAPKPEEAKQEEKKDSKKK